MCLAMNADKLEPGERCASTSNRNFEGRQGRGGRTHLVSPAMAAAAAVTGHLTDVREAGVASRSVARRASRAGEDDGRDHHAERPEAGQEEAEEEPARRAPPARPGDEAQHHAERPRRGEEDALAASPTPHAAPRAARIGALGRQDLGLRARRGGAGRRRDRLRMQPHVGSAVTGAQGAAAVLAFALGVG